MIRQIKLITTFKLKLKSTIHNCFTIVFIIINYKNTNRQAGNIFLFPKKLIHPQLFIISVNMCIDTRKTVSMVCVTLSDANEMLAFYRYRFVLDTTSSSRLAA